MSTLTISKNIDAPSESVFALVTDFAGAAERIDGIEKIEVLTDGPVAVGTRFRETRIMFGKESTEEMTVTSFDSPKRFTLEAESCGCHYTVVHDFTPVSTGTLMKMDFNTTPVSFMAKLMSPLSKLMAGKVRQLIEADLEDLKRVAEKHAAEDRNTAP